MKKIDLKDITNFNKQRFAFTIDTDFVSDDIVKFTVDIFNKYNIPVEIYTTNASSYLDAIVDKKHVIGVHPNFDKGSSHGESINDVIFNIARIQSSTSGFRSHKYIDSNDISEAMYKAGYRYKSNICCDLEFIKPFKCRNGFINFPVFFEDGSYLKNHKFDTKKLLETVSEQTGTIVFLFHPIHIAYNSSNFSEIRNIKDITPRSDYNNMGLASVLRDDHQQGIRTLLIEILEYIKSNGIETITLKDYFNELSQ